MKMFKIIIISTLLLVLSGAVLVFVNYYVYSWTSHIKPFGCKYKSINVEIGNEQLSEDYDLVKIRKILKQNLNYKIERQTNDRHLHVSRMFNDTKYNIWIDKKKKSDGWVTKVEYGNYNKHAFNNRIPHGEERTMPDYRIKGNIFQMLNDMHLTKSQKKEMKARLKVQCSPTTNLIF